MSLDRAVGQPACRWPWTETCKKVMSAKRFLSSRRGHAQCRMLLFPPMIGRQFAALKDAIAPPTAYTLKESPKKSLPKTKNRSSPLHSGDVFMQAQAIHPPSESFKCSPSVVPFIDTDIRYTFRVPTLVTLTQTQIDKQDTSESQGTGGSESMIDQKSGNRSSQEMYGVSACLALLIT